MGNERSIKSFCFLLQIALLAGVYLLAKDLKTLELLSIIIPIAIVILNKVVQGKYITLYNLFIIVLSLVHFSSFWLHLFEIPLDTSIGRDIFISFNERQLMASLFFSLSSLLILNSAAIIVLKRCAEDNKIVISESDNRISKILFFLLLPLMLYNDVDRIILTQTFSYSEAVYITTFLSRFEISFIIASLFIIIKRDSFSKAILIFLLIRAVLMMVFTGSRIGMILEVILFLYVYNFNVKISSKRLLGLGIISYMGLVVIAYVKSTRGVLGLSFIDYLTNEGIISSQLSEFGSTMETLLLAVKYDSSVGGLSGLTYLAAILTIFPFSTWFFPFVTEYRVAHDFLNPYAYSVGTLGGSFFAEQYLNFGQAGILLSFFFGLIFAHLQNVINMERNAFKSILCISLYYGILIYSRANMYDLVVALCGILYFLVLFWIINRLLNFRK